MKLVKTSLGIQLKQTNVENRLHISTKSPKEDFTDTVCQHFVDELKHCNSDMQMDLQLVPVFFFSYSTYLVVMLPFKIIIFLHNLFCLISFPHEFAIFQSLVTRSICKF